MSWSEREYKREYERARRATEEDLPPWNRMTPKQKLQARQLIDQYWRDVDGTASASTEES